MEIETTDTITSFLIDTIIYDTIQFLTLINNIPYNYFQ